MFAAQHIRRSQPAWLPVTLFFLILTIGSGPNSKYWWLSIEAKKYGNIDVGALGICDSRGGCNNGGLGYAINNDALGASVQNIPAFMIYHLVVICLCILVYVIQLVMLTRLHTIVGQYRKTGWIFWLMPVGITFLLCLMIAGDNLIVNEIRNNENVVNVVPQGSFWLTIPALLFDLVWLALSYDLYRLARISVNPHQRRKEDAIEAETERRRTAPKEEPTTPANSGWGMFKQQDDGKKGNGWKMPTLGGWGGQQPRSPADSIYNDGAAAPGSFAGSIWPGR